jgi:tetratricopeptide (TPR) repeat protein
MVTSEGAALLDSDRQAMFEVADTSRWNRTLIKARLLSDGGYFTECRKLLRDRSSDALYHTAAEKLEYIYRYARAEQGLGNVKAALKYYESVIEMGYNAPYYYAANSSFLAGKIYESLGNVDRANECYTKCLEMPVKEYRNTIFFKCRNALSNLPD